jgi:hypothetical protein
MGFNPSTKKQTTIFINRDRFQPIYKKTNNNIHQWRWVSTHLQKNKQQYSSIEMGFNPSTKKQTTIGL